MEHELKCWPEYYAAIERGDKTFELRINDGRNYQVGDVLFEREWNPKTEEYTGNELRRKVTYIMRAQEARRFGAGIQNGWLIMAIGEVR